MERKYQFRWELLGDLQMGRPNLGPTTRLEMYRLMQFCFRDVLEARLGSAETDQIFYAAGQLAGREFFAHHITPTDDFNDFVAQLQTTLREMGVGVLRIEKADIEAGSFVLTVSEDLDCSGMPDIDFETCVFDEGFIASLMESYSGAPFHVKEIDCWCTGDRTCRFTADRMAG